MTKRFLLVFCSIAVLAGSPPALLAETDGERKWRLLAEIRQLEAESLRSQVKALEKKLELQELEMHEKRSASKTKSYFREFPEITADGMPLATVALGEDFEAGTTQKTKYDQTPMTMGQVTTTEVPPASPPDAAPATIGLNESRWTFNYQVLKPTTRVFFDFGGDDPGEIDYFKDGDVGLSIDFLTLSVDYAIARGVWVSGFVGAGILSAAQGGEATGNAAVLMWNAGLSVSFEKLPVALEFGVMQGISASESLHGGDRNDAAFFVGMSIDKVTKKTPMVGDHSEYKYAPPQH